MEKNRTLRNWISANNMPRRPNPSTLVTAMRSVQGRESDYRQWSERATISGYNAATQSYEIVVTAVGPTGVEISSTNRTLRQVKSLFPTDVAVFNPGDSVLIGYVSEKKEHPIILGLGDSRPSTGSTPQITLPTASDGSGNSKRVGGAGSQGAGGNTATRPDNKTPVSPIQITDPQTGSTSRWDIDCSRITSDRHVPLPSQPVVSGAVGSVTWSITGSTGVTISGHGANGIQADIQLPNNAFTPGTAYIRQVRNCQGCVGAVCVNVNPVVTQQYNCVDEPYLSCATAWAGANCSSIVPAIYNECCPGPICTDGSLHCPGFLGTDGVICFRDTRTTPMLNLGCMPCRIAMEGSSITARDAAGNLVTVPINVKY